MTRYREDEKTTVLALAFSTALGTFDEVPGVKGRFKKELIGVGHYVKDESSSSAIEFSITPDVLTHWMMTFRAMQANGVKVPVPSSHKAAGQSKENFGFVSSMFIEGGSLFATLDLVGEDALLAASRNDVSIYSPPRFTDGKGNAYIRPILHVCMTPDPLIPGLGPFEQIAASLVLKESTMDWKRIAEAVGLDPGTLTDESAEAAILAALDGILHPIVPELQSLPPAPSPPAPSAVEVAASSRTDPLLINLVAERRAEKLDALVAAERITPARRDSLVAIYCDATKLPLALSGGGDGFETLVEIIAGFSPMSLGERTGAQMVDGRKDTPKGSPVGDYIKKRYATTG